MKPSPNCQPSLAQHRRGWHAWIAIAIHLKRPDRAHRRKFDVFQSALDVSTRQTTAMRLFNGAGGNGSGHKATLENVSQNKAEDAIFVSRNAARVWCSYLTDGSFEVKEVPDNTPKPASPSRADLS
ncbi:MAG TPA: hypothetical protein VNU49_10310 [Opitutaceae bacterium]|jgi:hypothetical protein|nr:hypothetical protein [Opitutaceae bacterium]